MNEIIKFAFVGVINTAIGYVVFLIGFRLLGFSPATANAVSYLVALLFAFLLNNYLVFTSSKPLMHSAVRFVLAFCFAFSINQLALFVILTNFDFPVEIAQIFAMMAYTITFYFLSKYYVFCDSKTGN